MRLTNWPGLASITPASMEHEDGPIDVVTKSAPATRVLGAARPSSMVSGAGWMEGSEKWTASMDGATTDGASQTQASLGMAMGRVRVRLTKNPTRKK
jgi:hypothetical protein